MAANGAAALLLLLLCAVRAGGRHECERPCREGGEPMDCRYRFVLSVGARQCASARSEECRRRAAFTINGDSPGPYISVCRNDTVTVHVRNALPLGMEAAIHWHGVRQRGTPFMDGAGMVTQCPIHSGTTFRYRFKAEEAGTFYYHAHSVQQHLDGLYGALVVRPTGTSTGRVVLLAPQLQHPMSFQQGIETDLSVTELKIFEYGEEEPDGRVRLINAAAMDCPMSVRRAARGLTVVAVDGNEVRPTELPHVLFYPGERVDFAGDSDTVNDLQVVGRSLCSGHGVGLDEGGGHPPEPPLEGLYLKSLTSASPPHLRSESHRVYLPFDLSQYSYLDNPVDFRYKLGEVTRHVPSAINGDYDTVEVYQFGNVSFLYPPSPTLTQWGEVDRDVVCAFGHRAKRCGAEGFCECLQTVTLPYNEDVDLVLVDEGRRGKSPQTVHLHGHRFHVIGMGSFEEPITSEHVKRLLDSGKAGLNLVSPLLKDTVVVPNPGYVVLRLRTDNPGDWLLESIPSKAKSGMGLELVLRVPGPSGEVAAPKGFPRCGTLKPQDLVIIDE